jgi:hypothetical protein
VLLWCYPGLIPRKISLKIFENPKITAIYGPLNGFVSLSFALRGVLRCLLVTFGHKCRLTCSPGVAGVTRALYHLQYQFKYLKFEINGSFTTQI